MSRSPFLAPAAAAVALMCLPAPALAMPRLSARLASCASGAATYDRVATFVGSMPLVGRADRLRMRFVLERRTPGASAWSRVNAPTFGHWLTSKPGVSGFVYTKRVEGLTGPADYRAVVQFRWIGRDGRVVRDARRVTASCTAPDPRPNLVPLRLHPVTGPDGRPVAELLVGNDGRGDLVTPTVVSLTVDGIEQPSRPLDRLAAGATTVVTFPIGACAPGSVLEAWLDPADAADETLETDNRLRVTC